MTFRHTVVRICKANSDGSYKTQRDRLKSLVSIGKQLREMGYNLKKIQNLQEKHINRLVERWKTDGLSAGTIKNRMAHLRWVSDKINKSDLVKSSNSEYQIDRRSYVDQERSAGKVDGYLQGDIEKIKDAHIKVSAEMQRVFGLRREEALKIQPKWADREDRLLLKGSWCKGGRDREIPINTAEKRAVLEKAKALAGNNSLIPAEKTFKQHISTFEYEMKNAGFDNTHGARHLYAQNRYEVLTGFKSPAAGGPRRSDLSDFQRKLDRQARQTISRELGHERIQITAVYLGG